MMRLGFGDQTRLRAGLLIANRRLAQPPGWPRVLDWPAGLPCWRSRSGCRPTEPSPPAQTVGVARQVSDPVADVDVFDRVYVVDSATARGLVVVRAGTWALWLVADDQGSDSTTVTVAVSPTSKSPALRIARLIGRT